MTGHRFPARDELEIRERCRVVGTFLIRAALEYDPQQARGLGGALQTLAQQPLGPWLLGAVALGLVAYGLFMLSVARYRHIPTGRVQ